MGEHIQFNLTKKDMDALKKSGGKKKKEQKAGKKELSTGRKAVYALGGIIAVVYFVLLIFGQFIMDKNGTFLGSLNPFSGMENPNNLIRVISLIILTLSVSFAIRYVIGRVATKRSAERRGGVALIELLGNLVKYVSILVLVFLILSAIGVNTTEILASLGILALIIGLGVTSLIEDIVAGIFIIAERLFDVNDVIVLDGFRGNVVEIGIRSTKIADVGGDILTVRNSSIGSVINLTDRQSSAAITMPIAPQESIEYVEEVIREAHIESIADKYPVIESGPIYIGLCEITPKGVQNLLFVAGCHEDNKFEAQRALYKELKIIFENNDIKLGLPGVVVEEEAV